MSDLTTGLHVSVYRNAHGDCTLGGVSSKFDDLTIVGVLDERTRTNEIVALEADLRPHSVTDTAPAVVLVKRHVRGLGLTLHLAPLETASVGVRGAMGGNYAATSDSRMSRLVGGMFGALPIHDRFER